MSEKALRIILWIAFTALFFVIFCGVQYLISGEIDGVMALIFFVVVGLVDKKGIGYLVEYYTSKRNGRLEDSAR